MRIFVGAEPVLVTNGGALYFAWITSLFGCINKHKYLIRMLRSINKRKNFLALLHTIGNTECKNKSVTQQADRSQHIHVHFRYGACCNKPCLVVTRYSVAHTNVLFMNDEFISFHSIMPNYFISHNIETFRILLGKKIAFVVRER